MALSLHQALGLHWAGPVVLRYQTADSFIRPPDDTAWREEAAHGRFFTPSSALLRAFRDGPSAPVVRRCYPWTTTTPSARCGGGVVNGSVRVGLRPMAASGWSFTKAYGSRSPDRSVMPNSYRRWPTRGETRSLRSIPKKSSCPSPHAGASDHGATPNVVGVGTTMDDAVPRHRWRQAFGREGER